MFGRRRNQNPPDSEGYGVFGAPTGQLSNAGYGVPTVAPMMPWNNGIRYSTNRRAPADKDALPRTFRRYVNASGVQDVQLHNGMRNGILTGRRIPYRGTGYLYGVRPEIPGQTRDNYGGYHIKGPSPLNMQAIWQNGPGSQPDNPGGPGKIAATHFVNPMTG